jgi:two-component system sensor histidine kinase/response regulator
MTHDAPAPGVDGARGDLHPPLAVRAFIGLGLGLAAAYAAYALGGWPSPGLETIFVEWIYDGSAAIAVLLCAWRAIGVREDRVTWALIALAFALELAANIVDSVLYGTSPAPTPSAADLLWIAFYIPLAAALGVRIRAAGGVRGAVALDILIATAALSSVSAAFVIQPVLRSGAESLATSVTAIAYPVADLVLAALVLNLAGANGWRLGRATGLMAGCIVVWAVTDTIFAVQTVHGSYVPGGLLDLGWIVPYALFGLAAWMRPDPPATSRQTSTWHAVAVPVAFAVVALAIVVYSTPGPGNAPAIAFAAAALLGVMARFAVTFHSYGLSLELHRHILDTANDAFIGFDERGVITEWNQQAQATFGWAREEALGRRLTETIVLEERRDAHRQHIELFAAAGGSGDGGKLAERPVRDRSGREFTVERAFSLTPTQRGYSVSMFMRDITERKRSEAELALARDRALEASNMKSIFVANVSHEIRTPMNGVIGMSELLLDTELDDEQREYAEMITSSGDALLEIIDDLLDVAKIEAGKLELNPTDFDLRDAVEMACGIQAARAHAKGLELVIALDPDLPPLLHGDMARLRQVISNFVANAIKFTANGEIVVRAHLVSADDGGDDGDALVRLEVSDTGIGIAPDTLAQLFTPFSQADSSTTRTYGGTGLGLAISKQLAELMGGRVGVQSTLGAGSTFWLELSLARAASSRSAPPPARGLAGMRVLVVDDNATSRDVLQQQLRRLQMNCTVAEDAATALRRLSAAARAGVPFALALLDQNMPDGDGYELARAIRAQRTLGDTRLVLLSCANGQAEGTESTPLFDGVLTKPVRQSRLHEEIPAILSGERLALRRSQGSASDDAVTGRHRASGEILVVDDTLVNQAVAVRMLEKCGYRARSVKNGREALQALSERPFAAVLMDCQMPELDGYETTREIRGCDHDWRAIPVIAMTASSMRGERERCLAAGMDDYLAKPLRNQALKNTLKRWVSESAQPAASGPVVSASAAAAGRGELVDPAVIAELDFDGEGLSALLGVYFEQADGHLCALHDAVGRAETLAIAQTAHALKGNSGSVGAVGVARLASDLEAAARASRLATAPDLLDQLSRRLDETRAAFGSIPPDASG